MSVRGLLLLGAGKNTVQITSSIGAPIRWDTGFAASDISVTTFAGTNDNAAETTGSGTYGTILTDRGVTSGVHDFVIKINDIGLSMAIGFSNHSQPLGPGGSGYLGSSTVGFQFKNDGTFTDTGGTSGVVTDLWTTGSVVTCRIDYGAGKAYLKVDNGTFKPVGGQTITTTPSGTLYGGVTLQSLCNVTLLGDDFPGTGTVLYISSKTNRTNLQMPLPATTVASDFVVGFGHQGFASGHHLARSSDSNNWIDIYTSGLPSSGALALAGYRFLNSTDLTAANTIVNPNDVGNDIAFGFSAWRGVSNVNVLSTASSSANTFTLTGAAPSANSKGVAVIVWENTNGTAANLSVSGFKQVHAASDFVGCAYTMVRVTGYAGANISLGTFTSGSEKYALLLDFT